VARPAERGSRGEGVYADRNAAREVMFQVSERKKERIAARNITEKGGAVGKKRKKNSFAGEPQPALRGGCQEKT